MPTPNPRALESQTNFCVTEVTQTYGPHLIL